MAKQEKTPQDRSIDQATIQTLEIAAANNVLTCFDRADNQEPGCKFGTQGLCCKNCAMGPCRIIVGKEGKDRGVCGATADTISARNFIRMVAGGASAHSDHGRNVAETLLKVATSDKSDYAIKDEQKAIKVAMDLGVEVGDRDIKDICKDIAEVALAQFGQQQGELLYCQKAPLKRQEIWRNLGVMPRGIDRETVEIMHRTHMGVDHDPEHLLLQGARAALADGWGGSMIGTELQDILFGTPEPLTSTCNLGIMKEETVNISVHGHEPLLSEMLVAASLDPEVLEYVKSKGATGVQLGGICCTANEILMRHGVPIMGNFLQQELALVTNACDAMIVDVQCIFPSLPSVAACFHGSIFTTAHIAKMPEAEHIEFNTDNALETAKTLIKRAADNYPKRPKGKINIPQVTEEFVAGFSHETINYMLGGSFRASYRPLNDNIINGKIRGVAGVVGCNNPKVQHDSCHVEVIKELIKNDVLVLTTGCGAIAAAKAGLLKPEAAAQYAGAGLAEVCETVGIPPVIHMGSCVDNSRILIAATAMVKEGGLGDDISDLPAAGSAPEWMSEKAISIGQYFVSSGVYTVFGVTFPTLGAEGTTKELFEHMEEQYGGMWDFEVDPIKHAQKMIAHIDKKRKALGIDKARERVLADMDTRREIS
jgi:carbon-monoxide dehydrogenase catalytic subunit